MGPVISPDITVHVVWYGTWKPAQKRIIREFINSFSAPIRRSPSVSDWWKVVQLYTNQTGSNISRTVTMGQEKNDRLLSQGRMLTRLSVQLVIKAAIKAKKNPLPAQSKGGLYFVLTSDDI
ncbi:putative protein EXORDIUM [Helianthus annuus]|uniref:Uncharacterized protein n=1 Tax=Helianthus annuus TaxID=4232 RepID=A0A9K3N3C3_HELAN|nr:putative protein EXORDIUM [Helianthus annuus]KAJ0513273.1 putative protein EXORDIUM [Helianthus annuus]KAJ0521051.1 putative protein EXORDIUM [Helianthus annuus]KAJ0529387.1 putative protein EXORDIUM [Helianthus annuus]KAJ0696274.1 putative protein EXORDIUM [Helianthus annuus]